MIERVLEIKKARGCAVLQLESGVLRVPLSLLRERPVRAGEVLDTQAYRLFIAQRGAQSRAHKHGRGRIERELTRRGVSREVAQSAVSELSDEEQLADAVRLTGKFLARTQGDFNRSLYNRTLAMLARHGYDADIARRALQIIAEGKDETPDDGDDAE